VAVVRLTPESNGLARLLLFLSTEALTLWCHAEAATTPAHDFHTYRPSVTIVRIPASEAPTIDGALDDPAWKKAAVIGELYQVEPKEGQPADERTIVRMLYDENNLYFGITCYDKEPKNRKSQGPGWRFRER
jgi:hypothetical protein